ncbi:MAG TPA: di-heme oxidoredictase family protein, partial [Thermodesulfobacteriota bacterium]|nr:di-heme oxidoredictase family protein [Thermodesulfobacteriota bacterium]
MRRVISAVLIISAAGALVLSGCDGGSSGGGSGIGGTEELMLGGDTTVFDASSQAFNFPATGLSDEGLIKHDQGDGSFDAIFVTSPSPVNPGLGPVFNNNSCQSCHANNGRGKPDDALTSLLFRISVPGESPVGGPNPVAGFGLQIQTRATVGTQKEAGVTIEYVETPGEYGDGTPYSLRTPVYTVVDPYIPLPVDILISPRIAPPVFGVGLLEAIPEDEILANADPADEDGDGISGRPNYVWDFEKGQKVLGRFGWKANTPTALQQAADAYNQDMGITSPLFPTESSAGQSQADGL